MSDEDRLGNASIGGGDVGFSVGVDWGQGKDYSVISISWDLLDNSIYEFFKISALPGITLTDKDDDGTQIEA